MAVKINEQEMQELMNLIGESLHASLRRDTSDPSALVVYDAIAVLDKDDWKTVLGSVAYCILEQYEKRVNA